MPFNISAYLELNILRDDMMIGATWIPQKVEKFENFDPKNKPTDSEDDISDLLLDPTTVVNLSCVNTIKFESNNVGFGWRNVREGSSSSPQSSDIATSFNNFNYLKFESSEEF